ncbi:hypothetical protein P171DRAFT_83852 [Karstenula rhodostoma CBS 690.94]|uniref:Uncharacterized protein n=1 Tax=Karstenula rhodostoma CBS 690.94 TaxID=1392251 RepID=A0A9P4PD19_9PLEO|nr:hypothetical protein P171DRAFT_83852 [Karstenula rhodostoma CBS 690.94]
MDTRSSGTAAGIAPRHLSMFQLSFHLTFDLLFVPTSPNTLARTSAIFSSKVSQAPCTAAAYRRRDSPVRPHGCDMPTWIPATRLAHGPAEPFRKRPDIRPAAGPSMLPCPRCDGLLKRLGRGSTLSYGTACARPASNRAARQFVYLPTCPSLQAYSVAPHTRPPHGISAMYY